MAGGQARSGKAEHDGIPVRQVMEAATEKFVGHRV
jgi:hypothetical protein